MKIKEWLKKFKREESGKKEEKKKEEKTEVVNVKESGENKEYPNRFLKFYHLNKERLNQQRRGGYSGHKKEGMCVRCKQKALPGIVFCEYHQQKQKEYNQMARKK
ncbi:MAG: hypothetical protein V2A62_00555 [Candidatus Woesearchaeota archaeon]